MKFFSNFSARAVQFIDIVHFSKIVSHLKRRNEGIVYHFFRTVARGSLKKIIFFIFGRVRNGKQQEKRPSFADAETGEKRIEQIFRIDLAQNTADDTSRVGRFVCGNYVFFVFERLHRAPGESDGVVQTL